MQRLMLRLVCFGAITTVSGCTTLKEDFSNPFVFKRPIYLVKDKALVSECRSLGIVSAITGKGGLSLQDEGARDMMARMAMRTEEAGGNVVLKIRVETGFMGGKATGEAFDCGEPQLKAIPDSERILYKPKN